MNLNIQLQAANMLFNRLDRKVKEIAWEEDKIKVTFAQERKKIGGVFSGAISYPPLSIKYRAIYQYQVNRKERSFKVSYTIKTKELLTCNECIFLHIHLEKFQTHIGELSNLFQNADKVEESAMVRASRQYPMAVEQKRQERQSEKQTQPPIQQVKRLIHPLPAQRTTLPSSNKQGQIGGGIHLPERDEGKEGKLKEVKEVKEVTDIKVAKETKDVKEVKEVKEIKEVKVPGTGTWNYTFEARIKGLLEERKSSSSIKDREEEVVKAGATNKTKSGAESREKSINSKGISPIKSTIFDTIADPNTKSLQLFGSKPTVNIPRESPTPKHKHPNAPKAAPETKNKSVTTRMSMVSLISEREPTFSEMEREIKEASKGIKIYGGEGLGSTGGSRRASHGQHNAHRRGGQKTVGGNTNYTQTLPVGGLLFQKLPSRPSLSNKHNPDIINFPLLPIVRKRVGEDIGNINIGTIGTNIGTIGTTPTPSPHPHPTIPPNPHTHTHTQNPLTPSIPPPKLLPQKRPRESSSSPPIHSVEDSSPHSPRPLLPTEDILTAQMKADMRSKVRKAAIKRGEKPPPLIKERGLGGSRGARGRGKGGTRLGRMADRVGREGVRPKKGVKAYAARKKELLLLQKQFPQIEVFERPPSSFNLYNSNDSTRVLGYSHINDAGKPATIEITKSDIQRLRPNNLLNDTLISFYLKFLEQQKLQEEQRKHIHIFNPYFFPKLKTCHPRTREAIFTSLSKWTRFVDIFSKHFLIFPICDQDHWFLIVVCFPAEIFTRVLTYRKGKKSRCDVTRTPCIIVYDSLNDINTNAINIQMIRLFLEGEYFNRKCKSDNENYIYFKDWDNLNRKTLIAYQPTVPKQSNLYDCGIFLLHYAEKYLGDPYAIHMRVIHGFTNYSDWFSTSAIRGKRLYIRKVIYCFMHNNSASMTELETSLQTLVIPDFNNNTGNSSDEDSMNNNLIGALGGVIGSMGGMGGMGGMGHMGNMGNMGGNMGHMNMTHTGHSTHSTHTTHTTHSTHSAATPQPPTHNYPNTQGHAPYAYGAQGPSNRGWENGGIMPKKRYNFDQAMGFTDPPIRGEGAYRGRGPDSYATLFADDQPHHSKYIREYGGRDSMS